MAEHPAGAPRRRETTRMAWLYKGVLWRDVAHGHLLELLAEVAEEAEGGGVLLHRDRQAAQRPTVRPAPRPAPPAKVKFTGLTQHSQDDPAV
jgi:hypothetical protein